ncbi:MAG TPA: head GIN domain-containing protein [Casimicrobiaceae bacterium]
MKVFLIAFAALVLAALATIAAVSFARNTPTGEVVREDRAATGFHRLEIDGQVEVTLVQGAAEGVTVEAPSSMLRRVRTEVRDGTLFIDAAEQRRTWQWFSGRRGRHTPRVTVNLREVDRIEAAGAVTVAADSLRAGELRLDLAGACSLKIRDLQATTLRLDGSGAIKANIAGKVQRQRVDLSGAGSFQASKLASDEAVIGVSGAGKAVVDAANSLEVDISGAGAVEYLGDPKVKQSISGIGKVRRRERS